MLGCIRKMMIVQIFTTIKSYFYMKKYAKVVLGFHFDHEDILVGNFCGTLKIISVNTDTLPKKCPFPFP